MIEERQKYIVQYAPLLPFIEETGWILDLGGGGEGVIGQAYGERVVSIDRIQYELEDAPGSALKIVMDAAQMQFLDNTFHTAAAFFFLFFVEEEEREAIFREVYRVLRPGGRWLIWDMEIPPYPGGEQTVFVARLQVHLPDGREVRTGYGAAWAKRLTCLDDVVRMAERAGFVIESRSQDSQAFHLALRKPQQP